MGSWIQADVCLLYQNTVPLFRNPQTIALRRCSACETVLHCLWSQDNKKLKRGPRWAEQDAAHGPAKAGHHCCICRRETKISSHSRRSLSQHGRDWDSWWTADILRTSVGTVKSFFPREKDKVLKDHGWLGFPVSSSSTQQVFCLTVLCWG